MILSWNWRLADPGARSSVKDMNVIRGDRQMNLGTTVKSLHA
jgi:hypothetical protein